MEPGSIRPRSAPGSRLSGAHSCGRSRPARWTPRRSAGTRAHWNRASALLYYEKRLIGPWTNHE
ncbi:hypothetical protein ACFPRL_31320 [Pseudoclavibacter helvolus]